MNNKQKKVRNHKILGIPVLGALIASLIALVISEYIIGLVGIPLDLMSKGLTFQSFIVNGQFDKVLFQQSIGIFSYLTCIIGGIVMIFIHKNWFQGEFKGIYNGNWGDKKTKIIIGIAFICALLMCIVNYVVKGCHEPTLSMFAGALMAGICEEVCFRLVPISVALRKGADKKNICIAIAVSTAVFGFIHFNNASLGQSVSGTIIQVLFAMGMGVFFGAVYLRTGNLLITMIFHTVYDFCTLLQADASGIIVDAAQSSPLEKVIIFAFAIVCIVFGIMLLKGHSEEIKEIWKERWSK